MSELFDSAEFEPTPAAAQARLAAVRPAAYARSRNALDGEVTRLSPYLTHGLLSLPQALAGVLQRGPLPVQHKLVYEFGWREFFHHVWAHRGDGIFESLHEGVLPDAAYADELPRDIREGATGVPVIDTAVRTLYATGYLHNHARMWLASYVVHLRKVHWRPGADWMYGHLLDGDLASNHLSWQWVAGTGSSKPYLFKAENVARYAPAAWHSPGTVLDTSYEQLEQIARQRQAAAGSGHARPFSAVAEPALHAQPPAGVFGSPDMGALKDRDVVLVHPWSLAFDAPPGALRVAVVDSAFHRQWPWSAKRWAFVGARLQQCCDLLWCGPPEDLLRALSAAHSVHGTHSPHLNAAFNALPLQAAPRLLRWPAQPCTSFSQLWTRATKGLVQASELLPD